MTCRRAQPPIDPQLAELCDRGDIESYTGDVVAKLGDQISRSVEAVLETPMIEVGSGPISPERLVTA